MCSSDLVGPFPAADHLLGGSVVVKTFFFFKAHKKQSLGSMIPEIETDGFLRKKKKLPIEVTNCREQCMQLLNLK